MKQLIITVMTILLFFSKENAESYSNKSYGDIEGVTFVDAYDGDTIRVNIPGVHPIIGDDMRIRVNAIDTPEIRGRCDKEKYDAIQARDMVRDILKEAKQIDLKNIKRGKYFRIAADVYADGENIGDVLVESGMAIRYDGGRKTHSWCDPPN